MVDDGLRPQHEGARRFVKALGGEARERPSSPPDWRSARRPTPRFTSRGEVGMLLPPRVERLGDAAQATLIVARDGRVVHEHGDLSPELLGHAAPSLDVFARLPVELREPLRRALARAEAHDEIVVRPCVRIDGGDVRPLELRVRRLRTPERLGELFAVSIHELTEARRRGALPRSYGAKMFERAPVPLLCVDRTGGLRDANARAATLLGLSVDELRARTLFELVDGADRAVLAAVIGRAFEDRDALDGEETEPAARVVRLRGLAPARWVEVECVRLEDGASVAVATLLPHHPPSEREDDRRAQRQGQRLELVGGLAVGITHDLNNVLMAVAGSAQRAEERIDRPGYVLERLAEIRQVAAGGATIVRRLTTFTRDETFPVRIPLEAVVRDVASMLRPVLGEDIELAIVLEAPDVHARMDAGRLEQVLVNLAVNARDAMPAGGRVEIVTHRASESTVRLSVRDTGSGMDPGLRGRIFEPFFTTKRERGTGLGLSIVKSIVEECGGRVSVESHPGVGTTFTIELPVATGDSVRPPELARPATLPPQDVLLVDDDALVRAATRRFLERGGHRVHEASTGEEALALLEKVPVDVLLTDVVLGRDLGGRELAARARTRRPSVRVLFMSGYAQHELIRRGGIASDAFVLQKPFSQRELDAALGAQVGVPRAESTILPEAPEARGRVLLVESSGLSRDALAGLLADVGYEVQLASSAAEARAIEEIVAVDVLVTAAALSDGRGAALAEALTARRPAMGVIVLAARPDDEDVRAYCVAPHTIALPRPSGTGEIVAAIEAVYAAR